MCAMYTECLVYVWHIFSHLFCIRLASCAILDRYTVFEITSQIVNFERRRFRFVAAHAIVILGVFFRIHFVFRFFFCIRAMMTVKSNEEKFSNEFHVSHEVSHPKPTIIIGNKNRQLQHKKKKEKKATSTIDRPKYTTAKKVRMKN